MLKRVAPNDFKFDFEPEGNSYANGTFTCMEKNCWIEVKGGINEWYRVGLFNFL